MKFYECHGHIAMSATGYAGDAGMHKNGPDESLVRANLEACQRAGVVFYRDGGDIFGACGLAKRLAAEYGIDYRSPMFAIHKKGRYGSLYGLSFDCREGYMRLLGLAEERGADFIKLMASGIVDFSTGAVTSAPLEAEELGFMIGEAHRRGFAVMVHVNGAQAILDAVLAGADSIEHGYYMDAACLAAMAERGTVWVPTAAPISLFGGDGAGAVRQMLGGIAEQHGKSIKRAAAMGVLVASGSDAGASGVHQGYGITWEERWLEMLGADTERANLMISETFKRR